MSVTLIDQINGTEILAKRAECSKSGVDIDAKLESIPSDASVQNLLVTTTAMQTAIGNFGGFKISTLDSSTPPHPDETNPSTKLIYLTKDSSSPGDDKYTEWIYAPQGTNPETYAWEKIGVTALDLSNLADVASTGSYYDLVDEPYAPTVTSGELKFGTTRVMSDSSVQTIYSRVAEISYTFGNSEGPVCIIGRVIVHQYGYQNPVTINYRLLWARNAVVTQAYYDIMSGNESQIKVENFRIGYIATTSKLTLYIKLTGNHICANLFVDMIQSYRGSAVGSVEYYLGTDGTSSEPSGIVYLTPRYARISTIMGFLPGTSGPADSAPAINYMYKLMDIVMDGTYKSITLDCLWHQGLGAYENELPTHMTIYLAVGGTAGTLQKAVIMTSDATSYTVMRKPFGFIGYLWGTGSDANKLTLYMCMMPDANYQQSFEVLGVSTNCYDSPVFYSYTSETSQNYRETASLSLMFPTVKRTVWMTNGTPVGGTSDPVYINENGEPTQCGKVTSASSADNADTVDNYHISVGYSSSNNTICFY